MSKVKRYITAGGTVFCALSVGFFMQMTAQENKTETGFAPEPVKASIINGVPPQGAGLTDDGALEISDIQLTAAGAVSPPKGAPTPQSLPDQPLARTAFDDAATSEARVGELPREEPAPEFSCDFELTATPTAAAMVDLELNAPCMVNER